MDQTEIINKTTVFVKETLKGAEAGHDYFHIERVYKNATKIAATENVNSFIVELGALLHDIADAKFHDGDETIGPRLAKEFLLKNELPSAVTDHVLSIIENMSFKSSLGNVSFTSIEMNIVQDADRLDAIGAIGIARALYNNPELLIMDEATSALDNITEKQVIEAIEALKGTRTIIMIAHRLTTVMNCDKLYFMKNGEIIKEGTYQELLNESSNFRKMALG